MFGNREGPTQTWERKHEDRPARREARRGCKGRTSAHTRIACLMMLLIRSSGDPDRLLDCLIAWLLDCLFVWIHRLIAYWSTKCHRWSLDCLIDCLFGWLVAHIQAMGLWLFLICMSCFRYKVSEGDTTLSANFLVVPSNKAWLVHCQGKAKATHVLQTYV